MDLNMCSMVGDQGRAPDALDAALRGLGFGGFWPGQRETVESVLRGEETLAVMATGGGKSLCYLLPARLLDGVTVVVTPLLALMRDQVAHATARGVAAVALGSVDPPDVRAQKLAAVAQGHYRVVLAAPEGLRAPAVLRALRRAGVALLCVDEAHCISAWGHDFRPDYARLGVLRQALGAPRLLAMTATATPLVQQDMVRGLGMRAPRVILAGCDRPNLALAVEEVRGQGAKRTLVRRHVAQALAAPGSVIVYCATRSSTVEVAAGLERDGVAVRAYHAGMAAAQREAACRAWEAGEARVMVATSAFGMGVHKPDVRLVLHHAVPRSPEAYWQEVGRAGRDGAPARGVLLLDGRDLWLARQRLAASTPDAPGVLRAWEVLRHAARRDGYVAAGLEEAGRLAAGAVGWAARACVAHLAALGALEVSGAGVWLLPGPDGALAAPAVDAQVLEVQRAHEEARLAAMEQYARHARCRRALLVAYFSQVAPPPCGMCDACNAGALKQPGPALVLTFRVILSCVARLMGGYGRARVVEVLLGSQAQAVARLGLQRQSTFGRLRGMPRAQLLACIQALETAGLLQCVGTTYPTLDLTPQGDVAMRTGVFPPMRLDGITTAAQPRERRCTAVRAPPLSGATLEMRLRSVDGGALEERLVHALALLRPRTLEELAQVPGLGRARCARLGPQVLEIIHNG